MDDGRERPDGRRDPGASPGPLPPSDPVRVAGRRNEGRQRVGREALKRTVRVVAVAGLAVAMFGLGAVGIALRGGPPKPAAAPANPRPAAADAAPVVASGSLPELIAGLQARLRSIPRDWRSFAELGLAYVQEGRVTADPTYYPKAEDALDRSLALNGSANFDAFTGQASLAAARHDFAGALAWGQKAVAANPHSAQAYAVVGDAQVELGSYDQAFATFQMAVDLKPELSTYARASYAWELQGNVANARAAMRLAVEAAASPSDAAWADNQLGELSFNSGRLDQAEASYREAVARDPSYLPPHAGLAKVESARGDLTAAITDLAWVVARYPTPEYVIALGDLYTVSGRDADAERQFALVGAEEQLFQANGVNMDLEIALFDADHGVELAKGLAAAQAEWARRHSIHVADALAWQLYANGRYREALSYANQALRLGTQSALFFFHRGMIEKAMGRTAVARTDLSTALAINPHFSILWAGSAARTLAQMGGSS
jgi:tetratricopeptide (TPR) repeat protein